MGKLRKEWRITFAMGKLHIQNVKIHNLKGIGWQGTQICFTPKTVQEAAKIISKEFRPLLDYFKAMTASVEERLRYYLSSYKEMAKEYLPERKEIVVKTIAEDIVRQILGV